VNLPVSSIDNFTSSFGVLQFPPLSVKEESPHKSLGFPGFFRNRSDNSDEPCSFVRTLPDMRSVQQEMHFIETEVLS